MYSRVTLRASAYSTHTLHALFPPSDPSQGHLYCVRICTASRVRGENPPSPPPLSVLSRAPLHPPARPLLVSPSFFCHHPLFDFLCASASPFAAHMPISATSWHLPERRLRAPRRACSNSDAPCARRKRTRARHLGGVGGG